MRGPSRMGFDSLRVTVEDLADGFAVVRDKFGKVREVPLLPRRGKGGLPRVGEVWIIEQALSPGAWTFGAVLQEDRPVVTGSTDGIPALDSLLEALEEIGYIDNQTVSTRIRATHTHTHTHTHTAPSGGGTTSSNSTTDSL